MVAGEDQPGAIDFFVSYTGADRGWAEWIAWQLEDAGYRVVIQAWDFGAGSQFVRQMHQAAQQAARTVAVLSAAYLSSAYGEAEWQAAWAADPLGRDRKLLVFRVQDCALPGLLGQLVSVDLFGLTEDDAHARLLAAAAGQRGKPARPPAFPGHLPVPAAPAVSPQFPGLPAVWNVPARLGTFTGRQSLLEQVRVGLTGAGGRVAVTALRGLGGVGKTQLAVEYAWRHAADYQLVWWINAEQEALVAEQLAALAPELGLPATENATTDAAAVLARLARRDDWLLVFDNAGSAREIRRWLPASPAGHVLITSRAQVWGGLAVPVDVDVFDDDEAIRFLAGRVPALAAASGGGSTRGVAAGIAAELGCLPLALEQAAAYMEAAGTTPASYLQRFRARRKAMLARGEDLTYGGTVDTCWSLALDRLQTSAPTATSLLTLAAFFGPEPIQLAWLTPTALDEPLRTAVADGDFDDLAAAIRRYSLARRDPHSIQLHRLVAAVIRAHLPLDVHTALAVQARRLLAAARPGNPEDRERWPAWASLLPHLLSAPALVLDDQPGDDIEQLLADAGWYLFWRGNYPAACELHRSNYERQRRVLGEDDPRALWSAHSVGAALHALGDYSAARDLHRFSYERQRLKLGEGHEQTIWSAHGLAVALYGLGDYKAARDLHRHGYNLRRQSLGDDHPDTLWSAHRLADALYALGDYEAARDLHQHAYDQQRRVLGEDHYETLWSAHRLGLALHRLGDYQGARDLHRDTLVRQTRVLGEDHPRTLQSAYGLATALTALGDSTGCDLHKDTYDRRCRVLGKDHPQTLQSANSLGRNLYTIGDFQKARELDEDTLTRRRRVLGDDHPDTLRSANNLTIDLRALGEDEQAGRLEEEMRRRRGATKP